MDDELSLKDTLYNILQGLQSEKNWRETGEGLSRVRDIIPNVTESLSRGGIAQAIGTSGDFRDLGNTVKGYLPKSVRNFTTAAEFLANPYSRTIQEIAPTTESTKEFVPRITETYPGYEQHETLGEYIAPSLGYFGGKSVQAIKATKDLPIGASIIGPESKLWNKEIEFNARRLESKGAEPEEILQKTGLVRGLDGRWRSEITDLPAKMKPGETFAQIHGNAGENPTVKDVIEHPQLFEAYPHLGDIQIRPHSANIPARGSYNQNKNLITLREDLTPQEAKSVILHELTHGVQGAEEFNRGASAAQLTDYYAKQKEGMLTKIQDLNGQMKQALDADEMDKYRQLITERDVLSRRYTDMNPEELGYEDYFKHGGEAEARMVQKRAALTPEQLRQRFPYQYTGETGHGLDINPDEAIITTKTPGTINMPEQSIEPPTSKQDELGFHSSLENAVFGIKQPKGTGDQFLKQLEKTPGVKAEELEVTGLKKYLQDHPTVSKQEVQDFIENNRVKLENKILAENTGKSADDYQLEGGDVYHDQDYINSHASDLHDEMMNDPDIYHAKQQELVDEYPELYKGFENEPDVAARLNDHVDERLRQQAKDQAHEMYYDNPIRHYYDEHGYEIYGNDDFGYSIKTPDGKFLEGPRNGLYDISDAEAYLREHHLEQGNIDYHGDGAKYADYVLPGEHTNYQEVLTTLPGNTHELSREFDDLTKYKRENPSEWTNHLQRELDAIEQKLNTNYESGHYDEPNILAHMRVNDRTINGKKTLMVEEIQSDWHQEGRKKGYANAESDKRLNEITKEQGSLHKEKMTLRDKYDAARAADDVDSQNALSKQIADIEKQQVTLQKELNTIGTVPDAPHKKTWHEMMVKQALDMAAKGDYDAVAFTTGKQQADRYNLAKYIETVIYNPQENKLVAWDKNAQRVIDKEIPMDQLEDYIGKEAARKIDEAKANDRGEKVLNNADLQVGGEGMKGFYDKILPDYINKYTKKWGMGMKKANLPLESRVFSLDEINKMLADNNMTREEFNQLSAKEKNKIWDKAYKGDEVHYVELSDAAKKDIKEKGQPLFAGLGAIGGADYMAGLDEQNKKGIFKDLNKAKKH